MLISHEREKRINAIIYFLKHTKYCGKTKLFKLLYFLDFEHFKETSRSVTGLNYITWPKGPAPINLFEELKNPPEDLKKSFSIPIQSIDSGFFQIKPKKKFDNKFFTKRELRILERVAFIFKETLADDMVKTTHLKNDPWDITKNKKGMNKEIDYLLAINGSPNSLPLEEILERIKEKEEIEKVFA